MQLTQYINNAKSLDELLVVIGEHHRLFLENDKLFFDFGGNVNDVITLDIVQKLKKLPTFASVDFFQRIELISNKILKNLTEEERLAFHNKMKVDNLDNTPQEQDDLPPARDIFEIEKEIEEMDKKVRASVKPKL